MKEAGYYRNKEISKFIVIVLAFLTLISFTYYFYFYTKICNSKECFTESLVNCDKSSWINDAEEATWRYTIEGVSEDKCNVNVELLIIKKGKIEMEKAQGKSMVCSIPLYTLVSPEQDLSRCSGELKEEMQELLIKRLHSYILENLGKVSEELTKAI